MRPGPGVAGERVIEAGAARPARRPEAIGPARTGRRGCRGRRSWPRRRRGSREQARAARAARGARPRRLPVGVPGRARRRGGATARTSTASAAAARWDGALGVAAAFEVAARVPGVRDRVRRRGGRALQHADVRLARAGRAARRRRRARPPRRRRDRARRRDARGRRRPARSPTRRRGCRACAASSSCTSTRRATARGSARPLARVRELASRLRLALEVDGRADHAGTTRRGRARGRARRRGAPDRRRRRAAGGDPDFSSRPRGWSSSRTRSRRSRRGSALARRPHARPGALAAWRAALKGAAAELPPRGVEIESDRSQRRRDVRPRRPRRARRRCPRSSAAPATTRASSPSGCRPGWCFVRNATGVSHAPDEHVELEDAAVGTEALLRAARRSHERRTTIPAMVNAHSHAFQRELRGAARAAGARGARRRRVLDLARGDVLARRQARPGLDARRRPRASTPRCAPRATARSASSTTSTTSPTGRRTRTRRDGGRRGRGGARGRPRDRPAPGRLHRAAGTAATCRPRRPAALLRPERRRLPRARGRAARGRRARRVTSASPRTACAPCPRLAGGDRRATPSSTASSATSTRTSSRASSRSARPSTAARRSSCCTAPASSARARASSTASTSPTATSSCWPRARPSSSPARRPRATSATATSPRCG